MFVLLKNSLPIMWENARQGYTEHDQNAIGLWGVGEGTRGITLATYATGFLGLWLPVCLVQLSGSRGLPNGVLVMGAATDGQTGPRGCFAALESQLWALTNPADVAITIPPSWGMGTYSHSSSYRSQSLMAGLVAKPTCSVWLKSGPERLTR